MAVQRAQPRPAGGRTVHLGWLIAFVVLWLGFTVAFFILLSNQSSLTETADNLKESNNRLTRQAQQANATEKFQCKLLGGAELFLNVFEAVAARVQFGQLGGRCDGIAQITNFVDKATFKGIPARPDLALRHLVDGALFNAAESRDVTDEIVITLVDDNLEKRLGIIGHFAVRAELAGPRA